MAEVVRGLGCADSSEALSPAPVAPRNSRREVTLYFLSETGLEVVEEAVLSEDFVELVVDSLLAGEDSLPAELSVVSLFFDESPFAEEPLPLLA